MTDFFSVGFVRLVIRLQRAKKQHLCKELRELALKKVAVELVNDRRLARVRKREAGVKPSKRNGAE